MGLLSGLVVEVVTRLSEKGLEAAKGAAQGWLEGWRFAHLSPEERANEVLARLEKERLAWEEQRRRDSGKK